MNILNRIKNNKVVYFLYFLKNTKWDKLRNDMDYVCQKFQYNKTFLIRDMVFSSLSLGTSFHEYYYYAFYNKNKFERKTFGSMSYMYEFQLFHNPKRQRYLLEDKLIFLKEYEEYIRRQWLNILEASESEIGEFLKNKTKVVLKNATGGAGKNVSIIELGHYTASSLKDYARKNNFNLLEEFVFQHQDLQQLSPNSLNTIRLITQINGKGQVDVIGTILRMGINLKTDNLSTGGIACPIDLETGKITGPGISFDITKPDYYAHPISGIDFIDFEIPYWKDIVSMCEKAALFHPENKSIGWDVAIKDDGPFLLEGNHDWGARLWQMPVKKGLKHIALKYFK